MTWSKHPDAPHLSVSAFRRFKAHSLFCACFDLFLLSEHFCVKQLVDLIYFKQFIFRLLRQSIQQPERSNELIEYSQRSLYLHVPKISPCKISHGQPIVMFTEVVSTLDFAGAFNDGRRLSYVYKVSELFRKF